jgi:hypothetical protein
MHPFSKYPVLVDLLKPFRWTQRLTLALVIVAIIEASAARSMEIATLLSDWLDIRFDSALNRLYRCLRNFRWLDSTLTKQVLTLLSQKLGDTLLIAIDWTEWHHELRMLVAAVVSDRRAIPVQCAAFDRQKMPRSQNSRENTFVKLLNDILRQLGLKAVLLCDRGFRRASWLLLLLKHELDFVVRLKADVCVEIKNSKRRLDRLGLQPGQVLDLGFVPFRSDGVVTVRVIGVWAKGAKEPWWVATNLKIALWKVIAYYDRRMTIEEQFRDTKGQRFGVKIFWTQFKNPDHLGRFTQLVGVAIFVWTAVGIAASRLKPSLRFNHPTKGPRQSFVTIGMRAVRKVHAVVRPTARNLVRLLLKPKLRRFVWLEVPLCAN